DNKEKLWFSTYSGLYCYDIRRQSLQKITLPSNAADDTQSGFVNSIYQIRNNDICFGTSLNGIYIYNPETKRSKTINTLHGLSDNHVMSIKETKKGEIVAATVSGISIISNNGIINIAKDLRDIVGDITENGLMVASNGDIFVSGTKGFCSFNVEKVIEQKE